MTNEKIYVSNAILEYWSQEQSKHIRVEVGEVIPADFPKVDLEDFIGQGIIVEQEPQEPEYIEDVPTDG